MTLDYLRTKHKRRLLRNNQENELGTAVPALIKTGSDGSLIIIVHKDDFLRLDNPGADWYPPDNNRDYYRLIVD